MSHDAFPGVPATGAPAICLDLTAYAQQVFGSGEPEWFDTPTLMAHLRQAQQGLRADWVLLSLLDWAAAWWSARRPGADAARSALRTLRQRLEDAALRAALTDVLRALHGVIGGAGLALQLADGAQWLVWGGDDAADADDAEEALVYLAALLHGLAGSGIGAVVLEQTGRMPDDAAEHFAALTNAARHHGWPCALCAASLPGALAGFDALACRNPAAGQGRWLTEGGWPNAAAPASAPFIVARVPGNAPPDAVLSRIAEWRAAR